MLTVATVLAALALGVGTPQEAMESARLLAAADPSRCAIRSIGTSLAGHPIEVLVLSEHVASADSRPALLLVAGIDGNRPSSVGIAVDAARTLLADPANLAGRTFYFIPCANPAALFDTTARAQTQRSRNRRAVDDDRDRKIDEDPPRDLDGDGMIVTMRRPNPPPHEAPTHLPDPAEPRLMVKADAAKDLRATHTLYTEGVDSDGDGMIAEDAYGGVDYDRNFPHRWEEFDRSVGTHPLSEPETMALAKFVITHPRIVSAIVISKWDNLVALPDAKAKDITGKTPMALHSDDQSTWEQLAKIWKDLSGQGRAETADPSGSLALWLYIHRGIPTCATQLWGRPDPTPLPTPPAPAPTPADAPAPPADAAATTPPPPLKPIDEESAQWLAWIDRDQSGSGFVPWHTYDHPTLGKVEIGGFSPTIRSDPPPSEHDKLSGALAKFALALAQRQPTCDLESVKARMVAPGLVEIECEIVNNGWLPTATAMGQMNKSPSPIVVALSTPKERLEVGQRVTVVDGLHGAGGRKAFRWIVKSLPGERIFIESRWIPSGTQRVTVIDGVVQPGKEVIP